jgi:hypothetical protein
MGMKQPGNQLALPAEGNVPARLVRVVELGEHVTKYKHPETGEFIKKELVQLWYSLPTRLIEDEGQYLGKQHMVRTQRMKNSTSQKASLWDHRSALDASTTDFNVLLGKPCYVQLKHNEVVSDGTTNTYCNIIAVSAVPEGVPSIGELDTTPFYFDYDAPDIDIWTTRLWDGLRDTIKSAINYDGSAVQDMVMRLDAMQGDGEPVA